MNKITSLVLATVFGSVINIPVLAGQTISGKQYLVSENRSIPVFNNSIRYFPCEPINNNCQQIEHKLKAPFWETTMKTIEVGIKLQSSQSWYDSCVPNSPFNCEALKKSSQDFTKIIDSTLYLVWLNSAELATKTMSKLR
ncbi:MAG: hypothetical protein WBB28_23130 [Crinalium sp.]